jgi:hypothetical protein
MTAGDQWQAPSPTGDGREARLGLAVYNSQSVYFSPLEWLALIAAIGISIWCMATPLGGPKYELREPTHLLGAFVSRTNWGLALFGGILTIGGVVKDIGIFIEGWAAPRQGKRRVVPAASGRPRLRSRVGVVEQQQLHRTP